MSNMFAPLKFRHSHVVAWALLVTWSGASFAHDLVGDPATFTVNTIIAPGIEPASELLAAGVNTVTLLDSVYSRTAKLLDGALTARDFEPMDSDPLSERALKAFTRALRNRVIRCRSSSSDRVAARLAGGQGSQVISARQIFVWATAFPEHLNPDRPDSRRSEEDRGWGKSYEFTFYIRFSDVLLRGGDGMLDAFSWLSPREGSEFQWAFTAKIRKRPSRVEAELPSPGTLLIEDTLPLREISCQEVPRLSDIAGIEQNLRFTTAEEKPVFLQRLADKGNPDAAFLLGQMLLGAKADSVRGRDYLTKASAAGVGDAAWELAQRYLVGNGVERDQKQAISFLKAAKADPNFTWRASLKLNQLQVATDQAERDNLNKLVSDAWERVWPALRASPQSPDLNLAMAFVLGSSPYPDKNPNKAVDYLAAASKHGSFKASVLLGRCYLFGHTVPANWPKAMQAYAQALVQSQSIVERLDSRELTEYLEEIKVFRDLSTSRTDNLSVEEIRQIQELFLERLTFPLELPFLDPAKKR